ncbi:hypothetical protein B1C78_14670 [Thioalkalivibrio denitrificans]|uniref:Uncharacterized protein n=1 Tax=Thioalkalivibrio denitrificans TaxID=108003 RepID=A0A1V3NC40_9GAMM|nr:antitoxin Xre-like helix-turn-helix domain-containing protein [Thioalkalivibrio denitrificans]OOG22667.1 hypothetical protein B1C78_14670 [Thioalkalivibrio denitrificans]
MIQITNPPSGRPGGIRQGSRPGRQGGPSSIAELDSLVRALITGRRTEKFITIDELIKEMRNGLSPAVVERLRSRFALTQSEVLSVLGLSRRSYLKRKAERRRLSPLHSDRAYRLSKVGVHAEIVFSDEQIAHDWLTSYIVALGSKPIEALDTEPGMTQVENVLGRIEDGVYS